MDAVYGPTSTGIEPPTAPPRLPPRPHRIAPPRHLYNTQTRVPPPPGRAVISSLNQRSHTRQNEYVDTPQRRSGALLPSVHKNGTTNTSTTTTAKTLSALWTSNNTVQSRANDPADVITRQPLEPIKPDSEHDDSIVCSQCKRCQCLSCTGPRELPNRWVHGYNISPDTIVEATTCYCCLKGAFYHMFKDRDLDEDVMVESDPCACFEQRHCCQRWCCIGLMSVCVPCLFCYPPLKLLVHMARNCYNTWNRPGCRCQERKPGTKGLLDSPDGSSS